MDLDKEAGKTAEKSFKGNLNIRLRPELHRQAQRAAIVEGKTLNQFINDAIEHELANRVPG